MSDYDDDPFAERPKAKAISWKGAPDKGAKIVMKLDGPANQVHARDYDTNEPAYWDQKRTQPKYQAVVNGIVDGELRSLWVPIPSSLFKAISEAQTKAGVRMTKDGVLTVVTNGRGEAKNPRHEPPRLFTAKYEPPAESDPWSSDAQSDEPPF